MPIQSTGIGSGLDVTTLVSKLMQVESQPLTTLAKKEASYQAKLSAYGSLNGALGAFQTSLSSLTSPSTFQSLTASSGDATIVSATANSIATAGSYNVTVNKLAQGQRLSSPGQANTTNAIGSGTSTTISFQFGTIGGTATSGTYPPATTYTQDPNQTVGSITIDGTNNSLQGIRDAINAASMGVSASIVGDGSATPYHLVLNSSKTGVTSSLKISAAVGGDAAVTSLLNYDPAGTQNFTEVSTAQNASLNVNGIDITSASNSVTSAVQGVALSLTKVGTTTVSVATNSSGIQTGIASFVKAYNDLNTTIKNLTSFDATSKKGGLLLGDSTTQSVQNQVRNTLSTAVNGLGGGLTTLSQIGVSFQKDGSLALDTSKLTTALSSNFSDVGGLFASMGKASDSLASIIGSSTATKAGSYALTISQIATQGGLNSTATPTSTIASGTSLSITLDGINASVPITSGASYTAAQLATSIQSSINGTAAFSSAGSSVKVSVDASGFLVFQSNKYGSTSNFSMADGTGTSASSITGGALTGTAGVDVAGTLNGITAIGSGQTLAGTTGSSAEGLKILIAGGSVGARGTVNFSRGYASQLSSLLGGFLGSTGTISSTTDGVNRSIKDIGKQRDALNNRLFDVEARYRAQFSALDKTVSSLNNTSNFLTQQLAALTSSTR